MIQVINRALDILEFIATDPEKPKALGEIAGELKLNAGTCANIIKTLVERKYLEKIDKQKGYCLGSKAYSIGGNEGYQKELIDAARPEMEGLTKKFNENSLLCILNGDTRSVVLKIQSNNDLQANTATEKKAFDAASGRMLLAMLDEDELESFIEKFGYPSPQEWDGVTDEKSFRRQLIKIKSQGFASQTTKNQIIGIAVPLYKRQKIVASLSMYMPLLRYNNSNKDEIIRTIKKAAEKISKKFGD